MGLSLTAMLSLVSMVTLSVMSFTVTVVRGFGLGGHGKTDGT